MRKLFAAAALAVVLAAMPVLTPVTGHAQEKSPSDHIDEALEGLMAFLRIAVAAIPEYELPEVLPNGDIIIRRVHPPMDDPDEAPAPEQSQPPPDDGGVRL
jgi:hypothetical protein